MKVTIDLDTLVLSASTKSVKRGDSTPFEVVFLRDSVPQELPEDAVLTFAAKAVGDYAGEALALCSTFVRSETGTDPAYLASPSFNTEGINALFEGSSPAYIDLVAEFSWVPPGGGPLSSSTLFLRVEADVIRGGEGTPLALPTPEEWLATRAQPLDADLTAYAADPTAAILANMPDALSGEWPPAHDVIRFDGGVYDGALLSGTDPLYSTSPSWPGLPLRCVDVEGWWELQVYVDDAWEIVEASGGAATPWAASFSGGVTCVLVRSPVESAFSGQAYFYYSTDIMTVYWWNGSGWVTAGSTYTAGAGLTLTGETFSLTKDSTLSALTIGSGKTISAGSSITTHASNAAITTAQNGGITTGTGGSLTTSTGTVSFGNTGANGIIFYANNVALVTLPNGTSTLARTDSGQTFAGGQVFTGQISSSGSTSTASTDNVVNIATNDARYGQSIKAIAVADLAPIQSQTTLQSTGLSVTLSAGTWHIKAHTVLTNANTAAQAKFGGTIVGGSSAELYGMQLYGVGNSTALGDLQASPLTGGRAFASSLSRAFCDVDFVLVVTSGAPVVTTQYAQNSSTAGDTILKAGSYLIATKL